MTCFRTLDCYHENKKIEAYVTAFLFGGHFENGWNSRYSMGPIKMFLRVYR